MLPDLPGQIPPGQIPPGQIPPDPDHARSRSRPIQIPPDQEIASVTADGAYDARKCHDAIAERGAAGVIPPRKNAKPWQAVTAGAAISSGRLICAFANRILELGQRKWTPR